MPLSDACYWCSGPLPETHLARCFCSLPCALEFAGVRGAALPAVLKEIRHETKRERKAKLALVRG